MFLLLCVEFDLIASHVDLSMWSVTNVDGPCFPRDQSEVVVLQLQRQIILIDSTVDPDITRDLFGGNGDAFSLNTIIKVRKSICPESHRDKEVVIVADHIIQSPQLHSNEPTIGEIGKLSLVELMQENSIEWFDSLLESVLDFGLFACEGDD